MEKDKHLKGNAIKNEIKKHIEPIFESKFKELVDEVDSDIEKIEQAKQQGYKIQSDIEEQISQFEKLVETLANPSKNPTIANGVDFIEDDTLMINESDDNEFNNDSGLMNDSSCLLKNPISLEQLYTNIENLMNTRLLIDDIVNNNECEKQVLFTKCCPDLEKLCFGHIKSIIKIDQFKQTETIDHTMFELTTKLNDNFTFVKHESCSIGFALPNNRSDRLNSESDVEKIYDYLKIEIFDPFKNSIDFELKEKITVDNRIIKIFFIPTNPGIYEIQMNYKNKNVTNSPFHFVVLPHKLTDNQNINGKIQNLMSLDTNNNLETVTQKPIIANKLSSSGSFSIGRGRLLRKNEENIVRAPGNNNHDIKCSSASVLTDLVGPAQKRKSVNSNFDDNDEEMELVETPDDLSRKFNRISYNENSSTNAANLVIKNNNNNNNNNLNHKNAASNFIQLPSTSIISNHLRRNFKGCLNEIPPLKAEFLVKFEKCCFPIGVRPTKYKNFLIVCDSGANVIKLFDNTTGRFVYEIRDKPNLYTLKRPSAVLVNNQNDQEIFVKDDKEILVFDLSDNFRFIRKFGYKFLSKPYGLAFDSNANLVLVNADFKNPQILTINKENGELINARLYEPSTECAKTNSLITTFNTGNNSQKALSDNLQPIEKSKIRFLCSNQDYVYASDLGRSIVYKTNLNGEMQLAFGHFGKKKGEMCEPSGLFVDYDGNSILVGDSKNNRLQVIHHISFFDI